MKWSRFLSGSAAALLTVLLTGCLPIPVIDIDPGTVRANQTFTADGTGTIVSNVPQGTVVMSYSWDFGDGTERRGKTVQHTYRQAGTYTISLTVVDSAGRDASTEETITVQAALPPTEEDATEPEEDSNEEDPEPEDPQ